jgi:L-threonylcarbamoyladenylate synthase
LFLCFEMETLIGTDIDHAAALLSAGEVVAIPTETVYGLAANALNPDAVLRIYEAKDRPRFNPLILHVPSVAAFERYAREIPEACRQLADAFSPGPLTFLLPKRSEVPDIVTAGSDLVALRIPQHPVALELLSKLSFPLAAPSANTSGYVSPVTAAHVFQGLGGRIPYILDGGPCTVGLESTIVSFRDGDILIHRYGAVTPEDIERVTGKAPEEAVSQHNAPDAPGQLKSHYAPDRPLFMGDVNSLMHAHAGKRIAVISFMDPLLKPAPACSWVLSPSGDLHEAARNLFQALRSADAAEVDLIIAEVFPVEGLGWAINDRLSRAQFIHRF